jgi:hypothetical protein
LAASHGWIVTALAALAAAAPARAALIELPRLAAVDDTIDLDPAPPPDARARAETRQRAAEARKIFLTFHTDCA